MKCTAVMKFNHSNLGGVNNGPSEDADWRDDAMDLRKEIETLAFLATFAREVSFSLNRSEVLATAARRLYGYFRYSFAVFALPDEHGGLTAYSPLSSIDCRNGLISAMQIFPQLKQRAIYGYRCLGLDAPLKGGFAAERRFDIELPGNGGTIVLFCAQEAAGLATDAVIAGVAVTLSTALKNAMEHDRVRELSLRDGLTGLYNRRVLEEMLRLEESRRKKAPFSVMLIDVDDFKSINDTYGHPAGDKVLSTIGRLLMENSRRENVVARYGGEEFALLLTNIDLETTLQVAERLRKRLSEEVFIFSGKELKLTASFGVAHHDGSTVAQESIISRADQALYQAKRSGKNRVCFHEAAQVSRLAERRRSVAPRFVGKQFEGVSLG